ncbi:class I SAM-dependent methyltransferase [Chitinophaga sp. Hz27]|uniref:class I SAM-dependent methyltransferase n=1 Tax=Chitinophaga sp. Hz27 TaxID=3347169 RepID=UPI0035DFBA1B
MKIRNPHSRFDISAKKTDRVLEVGGGHNPHPRSNVVVDKYADDNTHRSGDIKVLRNQEFISADGEHLPFEDKSFDYVICNHVLEHVDNPHAFLQEQFRVAKRGYLEVPSLLGEHLYPKKSHRWVLLEIDNKLVMVDKDNINFPQQFDFGELFQAYLPKNSIGYKIMERTHANLHTVRIEWEGSFDYVINPSEETLLKYFREPWSENMVYQQFPKRSMGAELIEAGKAFGDICKSIVKSKVLKRH